MSKRAVIYLRVSTGRQAEKELPIESQLDQCRDKAAALDAEIIKIFSDEGISGRTDTRQQFQSAIAYCEAFPVDYFITWSTSRFARNRLDAQLYKRRLQKAGVQLQYVTVSIDQDSDAGLLHEGILELFDEHFSHQVAADTRRSMLKNAQDGFWNGGRLPFGFIAVPDKQNPKRRRLAIDESEAPLVKKIFRLRCEGFGGKAISRILNENSELNRGRKWNKTSVTSLLRNEKMRGQSIFGKTSSHGVARPRDEWIIVNSHPAIIDETTFARVQKIMDSETCGPDSGSPKSNWLFTGLLECEHCKSTLQIESAKGRAKRYYYYNCRRYQKGYGCEPRRINAEELDNWLSGVIQKKIFAPENLSGLLDDIRELYGKRGDDIAGQKAKISGQISDLQAKNSRLYGFLEDPSGPLALDDLAPRIRENKESIKRLQNELQRIDALPRYIDVPDVTPEELSEFLMSVVNSGTNPKKVRDFYSTFITKIVVRAGTVEIQYRKEAIILGTTLDVVVPSTGSWLRLLGSNQRPND